MVIDTVELIIQMSVFVVFHVIMQPRHSTPRLVFKRAEKFIKEFRLRQHDEVRLGRQARWQRRDVESAAETQSKLAFAVRIRK